MSTSDQEYYAQFCRETPDLPLFYQPWWLDAVCGPEGWKPLLSRDRSGKIQAVWPLPLQNFYGFKLIRKPMLTPYLGIWQVPVPKSEPQKVRHEPIKDLIAQLPSSFYFTQSFHHTVTNVLPFIWEKYEVTTYYTYLFDPLPSREKLWAGLRPAVRNKIRKAVELLEVRSDLDLETLYRLVDSTFKAQDKPVPFSLNFLQTIDEALHQRGCRQLFFAVDQLGKIHAAIYLIWDQQTVYNLIIGSDPQYRSSGAVQLLLWRGLQLAIELQRPTFDFEGSMLPQIEPIFRAFGAQLQPYYYLRKRHWAAAIVQDIRK